MINSVVKCLSDKALHAFIQAAFHYQQKGHLDAKELEEARQESMNAGINEQDFNTAFNSLLKLISKLNRVEHTDKRLSSQSIELMEEFKIPEEKRGIILKAMSSAERLKVPDIQSLPTVTDVSWKFDVIIMNGKATPLIVVTMTDCKGNEIEVNLDLKSFHRLRHSCAQSFKDMSDLKAKLSC